MWPSQTQMVIIDSIILSVSALSLVLIWRGRAMLRNAAAQTALAVLLLGVATLSITYLYDLFTMIVLPRFVGRELAMREMTRLHISYSWYVHLAGFVLIAIGMVATVRAFSAGSARLAESERYFRDLFQTAPVALLEQDWSEVKARLDRLPWDRIDDLRAYLMERADLLADLIGSVKLSNANMMAVRTYEAEDTAALIAGYTGLNHHLGLESRQRIFLSIVEGFVFGQARVLCVGEAITAKGNPVSIRVTAKLTGSETGTWRRVILAHEDVTMLKQAEARLAQGRRMDALGQFTGGFAHDFNNLMAIMLGHAELLETRIANDPDAKESVDVLMRAVDRGAALTERLLAFSRQTPLSAEPVDLSHLVMDLDEMLRRTLGEAIDLKVRTMPDLWPAMIDRHQYENALVNLAINARDAMPNGGRLTIEASNTHLDRPAASAFGEVVPGDYVKLTVRDTGVGIPPEILDRVCDPFFTTKEVGKGSGLGLSMVYGLVKQSKGHLTIDSEKGRGTAVSLYVPRAVEDETKAAVVALNTVHPTRSGRILVVEDDADVRQIAVSILRGQGFEVIEASDGGEAMRRLRDDGPLDLVFTDIVLPGGLSGTAVAEQARRVQPDIKVLYATGYAKEDALQGNELAQNAPVVGKPYRRAELLSKLRLVLLDGPASTSRDRAARRRLPLPELVRPGS